MTTHWRLSDDDRYRAPCHHLFLKVKLNPSTPDLKANATCAMHYVTHFWGCSMLFIELCSTQLESAELSLTQLYNPDYFIFRIPIMKHHINYPKELWHEFSLLRPLSFMTAKQATPQKVNDDTINQQQFSS